MDGNGETTISYVKNWNHPIETTTNKWMFEVPGIHQIYLSAYKQSIYIYQSMQMIFNSRPNHNNN